MTSPAQGTQQPGAGGTSDTQMQTSPSGTMQMQQDTTGGTRQRTTGGTRQYRQEETIQQRTTIEEEVRPTQRAVPQQNTAPSPTDSIQETPEPVRGLW